MGTEVQSKMYLPGYYSSRDLNDTTGNGNWSLCQQNSMFGPYHDFLSTRPAIDVNERHDRLQLRQTILKHETMFRHQLHELHRLYKIQRDMMNEMRSRELHKYITPARSSHSILYSSGFPAADGKGRQHISTLSTVDLNHGRLTMLGADSIQCQFGSMKDDTIQSSYGPAQNGLRLKESESLESKCKKLQRRLFDLELPAEEYINEEKEDQGGCGVQVVESYLLGRNHAVTHSRDRNMSFCTGVNSGCNSNALSSHLYTRKPQALSNLDEPIKVKEASASASTNIFGNIICSKEEMERQIQSSNLQSGFQCSANKFSQDHRKGKDGVVSLSNLHSETERREKGWLAYNVEAGQTGSNGGSLRTSFCPEVLPTTSTSQQLEPRNSNEVATFLLSDHNRTQSHVKKKLFGVEIGERNHGASVEASSMLVQHPLVPKSDVTNSESSSISSWKKLYSGMGENMGTVKGNPSFGTFTQSNKSSMTLMHSPEVIGDKLLVSNNLRSLPSIRAEASYQNEHSISSQLESKESWVCFSSNGFSHLNGISDSSSACEQFAANGPKDNFRELGSMMNAKSAEDKKTTNAAPPNRYQNEAIFKPATDSLNRTGKPNPHGGLAWLKVMPSCNGNSSEERQGSSQMNPDSLQNFSQTFADRTEMMGKSSLQSFVQDSSSATCALDSEHWKTEVGECSSNRKVSGFSIFEKRAAKDLPTPNSPAKPGYLVPAVDVSKPCDPSSPEFKKQQEVEGLIEKGLINHSADKIHHIDLNLCIVEEGDEEEAQRTLSSSRTKIAIDIDLEAPVDVEPEIDIAPGFESYVRERQEYVKVLKDESRELHEGLIQVAAEALVAISSSDMPHHIDACCNQSEDSPNDPLHWFAEFISAYKGDFESEVGSFSSGQGSANVEHSISEGMDYFEFMTLNLTETKIEECNYKPEVFENGTTETVMPKRPRRGQARRGRQRKDFQRDILPSIALLLKNEVTEDLQTIEGLIKATGGTWQSSLSLKNTARNGGGKRKRRTGGSDSPPNATAVCPPQAQPPKCRELAFEETSLLGWGKRTRRPPRQRCPISSPPLSIK